MSRLIIILLFIMLGACATKPAERQIAIEGLRLVERLEYDRAVGVIQPILNTEDSKLLLALAHIYQARSNSDGAPIEISKVDHDCYLTLMESSASKGEDEAKSELSSVYHFGNQKEPSDKTLGECWKKAFGVKAASCDAKHKISSCRP